MEYHRRKKAENKPKGDQVMSLKKKIIIINKNKSQEENQQEMMSRNLGCRI